ncbi:MAG: molybdopterin-dependent oxidoreductase [Lachnospiraceae bacterium]|nr:molybdopterin-dependent oxidoreductase [Candidatus Equihabitans merdae]
MSELRYVGRKIVRDDGLTKVTGQLTYPSDLKIDDMYHGALVFASVPHALINDINVEEALKKPGVIDVITWKDVPGINGFGICGPEQPVYCKEKVRYLGDVVAMVVAKTERQARSAVSKVHVDYTVLETVSDSVKAMTDSSTERIPLPGTETAGHNKISRVDYSVGNVEKIFNDPDVIVAENDYKTPYEEHVYLETDIAVATVNENGQLELWGSLQYPHLDRTEIAHVMDLPEGQVIIHAGYQGGGFGSKHDMTIQPAAAVAAWKLKHAVRVHMNREESFLTSAKRVPYQFHVKTAADKEGHLLAHEVVFTADGGPFVAANPAIFCFTIEHSAGVYRFPNVHIEGDIAYTNNAHCGAFRGFGCNQICYALESQMDELAAKLGMDSLDFREMNQIRTGQPLSMTHRFGGSDGLAVSYDVVRNTNLYKNKEAFKAAAAKPYLKRGIGFGWALQGVGMGNFCPDYCIVDVKLHEDGHFSVSTGAVEMGQGVVTTCHILAAEKAQVSYDQIQVLVGDTDTTPDAGGTVASRSTLTAGNAMWIAFDTMQDYAAEELKKSYRHVALDFDGYLCDGRLVTWAEIYKLLPPEKHTVQGKYHVPETNKHLPFGVHYIYGYCAHIVGVEVNTLTGQTQVIESEILPAVGTVVNRLGYEGQAEGGTSMALGYALMEDFRMDQESRVLTKNLQTYMVPTTKDMPRVCKVTPIETIEREGPYGAGGMGEVVCIPGTPAITNAIRDAIGMTVRELPASPEKVLMWLRENA